MEGLDDLADETFFLPRLGRLLDCVNLELLAAKGPDLCYAGFSFSMAPPLGVMNCGPNGCGMMWIRPVTVYGSSTFPNPDDPSQGLRCSSPLAMEVEVGVARCYPRIGQRDSMPDPQEMFDATRLYMSDMNALKRAILCCIRETPATKNYQSQLGAWRPIEAQAGASGGTWQAWLG